MHAAIGAAAVTAELMAEDVSSTDWRRWPQRVSICWLRQQVDCTDFRAPPTTVDAVGRCVVVGQCDLTPDHLTRRLPT